MSVKVMHIEAEGSTEEILSAIREDLEKGGVPPEHQKVMLAEIEEKLKQHEKECPGKKEEVKKEKKGPQTLQEALAEVLERLRDPESDKDEKEEKEMEERGRKAATDPTYWNSEEGQKIIAGHALGLYRKYGKILLSVRQDPTLLPLLKRGGSKSFANYSELLTKKAIEYAELEEWAFKTTGNTSELKS